MHERRGVHLPRSLSFVYIIRPLRKNHAVLKEARDAAIVSHAAGPNGAAQNVGYMKHRR